MFKRREKAHAQPRIAISSGDGAVLYDGKLTGLALRDETIVKLSIQYFDDPEPCEIHRSAVLSRVFMELGGLLSGGAERNIDELGEAREYFAAYAGAQRVRLYTE